MSDLVLRTIGQAICLSTVGTFVFVMTLVTISANASAGSEYCYTKRCTVQVAQAPAGLTNPKHVKALAIHLWGSAKT